MSNGKDLLAWSWLVVVGRGDCRREQRAHLKRAAAAQALISNKQGGGAHLRDHLAPTQSTRGTLRPRLPSARSSHLCLWSLDSNILLDLAKQSFIIDCQTVKYYNLWSYNLFYPFYWKTIVGTYILLEHRECIRTKQCNTCKYWW